MTPEQIEAKAKELLKVLDKIYLRNEIKTFEIEETETHTFINFFINKELGFAFTRQTIEHLLKLNIKFYYSAHRSHFYYTIRKK